MCNWDWAEAYPLVAGGPEAGDRRGVVCAGCVGLDGCPALRRECEPGIQLAEALSRRAAGTGRPSGSAIDSGGGYGRTGCSCHPALDRRGDDRDRSCRPVPCPRPQRRRCAGTAACARCAGAAMIPIPSGVRVWLAVGRTDMRRGMNGLALKVQEALRRDPHAGDLYVFRGARGDLIKILWHDGLGMSLYAKRLEKGRFIWPSPTDGVVGISASQLAYMLDGIDWRNPRHTFRPERAG